MKLSICMMVKNEENNLERCLISLRPLMNAVESELIIVDTGSEDSTVEIAKKYTDKIYFHPWNNDFSAMRNLTLSYAKGEWVLIIDADEEIEDCEAISQFLNSSTRNNFVAGIVTIKSILHENSTNKNSYNFLSTPRLYKNNKLLQFKGCIHESIYYNGKTVPLKTTFNHYGYIIEDKVLAEKKFKRNISLLLSEIEKDPDNISYRNYICAQYFDHKDYQEALFHILKAYEIIKCKKFNLKDYLFIYPNLALSLLNNNKDEEARKICLEGLAQNDNHLDLYYILANIEMDFENYDSSIDYYNKYLSLMDNFEKLPISNSLGQSFFYINRYDVVYMNLTVIYIEQKKYDLSLKYIQKIQDEKFIINVFGAYIRLFIESGQFNKLKEYYENTVLEKTENVADIFLSALETYHNRLDNNEQLKLLKEFSVGESTYSKYCEIKIAYIERNKNINNLINTFISSFNINKPLYVDILYYLIDLKEDINNYIVKTTDKTINAYITVLSERFDDFTQKVIEYLDFYNKSSSFEMIQFNKCLYLYLINLDNLSEDKFRLAFMGYINNNFIYMNNVYGKNIFENEAISDVKDEYEAFIIYINKALLFEKENESEYIKYMKKALDICPAMNKGIKLLLSEHESNLNEQKKAFDQFEEYKIQVKQIIRNLIENGQLKEAKSIIEEYKTIAKDDNEIDEIWRKINIVK